MTDDPRRTSSPDPLRALDGATPPERWDDIVDRAGVVAQEGATPLSVGPATPARSSRRLLVAAAVLVVVAVAGGLALLDRDDGPTEVVAADRTTAPVGADDPGFDPPAGVVDREWRLVRFTRGESELEIPPTQEGGSGPVLRVTAEAVSFQACNTGSAPGGVKGDRLVVGPAWSSADATQWTATVMACGPPDGEARKALDDAVRDLLLSGPVIELDGGHLTLRSGDEVAEFDDPDWASGDPAEVPEIDGVDWVAGDAPCLLGRDRNALTTGWDWYADVAVGPAEPPVADPGGSAVDGETHGVWHLDVGKNQIEVRVPGLMVRDFVGERTEEVDIGRERPAILWFGDTWVQLRYFPGGATCDSFTVTVTGADETTNRAGAIAMASSIVTAERGAADPDEGPSSTVQAESDTGGAGGEDEAGLAEEGASELHLDELGVTRVWVLDRVEVDGGTAEAVDVENGGPDGMGGPPVLDATDAGRDGSFVRSCEVIDLESSTLNGRPFVATRDWVSVPYNPNRDESCIDGEQHQLLASVLAVGVVPVLVGAADGPELVLANDQGTLVFRPA